jgi:hypothetical protein
MTEEKKLDLREVVRKHNAEKQTTSITLETQHQYYAQFWYQEGKDKDIKDRCGPWHFEIPGTYASREKAKEAYKQHEDKLMKLCTDIYPEYIFNGILSEEERFASLLKTPRFKDHHQPKLITTHNIETIQIY